MGQTTSSSSSPSPPPAKPLVAKGVVTPNLRDVDTKSTGGGEGSRVISDLLKRSARVAKERIAPVVGEYSATLLEKTKEEAKKRGPVAEEYSRHAIKRLTEAYAEVKEKHGEEVKAKVKQMGKQASTQTSQVIHRGAANASSAINTSARTAGDVMSTAAKAAAQEAREAVPNALNLILRRVTVIIFGSVFIYGLATSIPPAYVDYLERRRKEGRGALNEGPVRKEGANPHRTRMGEEKSGGLKSEDPAVAPQSWTEWGRAWTDWIGITSRKKEQ